ncbi:Hypothetical predicted protein [Paramuricea clavata]|uniref:Uncharacterized protein n=1 Tax=Paramuricea clavata TaxID=317549 RepID=A0A7D9D7L1_PARCT|nr:Hypothetical predicted protein [Paramuricea clavata]
MICRESCLGLIHVCHELWEIYITYSKIRSPGKKKLCNPLQLQPYRNAGDSPECWYFNGFANYTDTTPVPEWSINAVDGGYSNWTLSTSCNVSCGDGVETWRRFCNNPEPKYGGHNCSGLGNSTELRNCSRKPCPIDGNYSNWTKSSPCSVTCGQGVEIWTRRCDNPPGKYGGNCSNREAAQEILLCEMEPCPTHFDSQMIGITTAAAVFVMVVAVACFIFILRRHRRKKGSPYDARLDFLLQHSRDAQQLEGNNTSGEASSSQEAGTSDRYWNLTVDGNPVPGLSRGVVRYGNGYGNDYMNTRPARNSWYDKLQVIRPLAMEWIRNVWGNIDEFGRHVYDVMHHVRHVPSPYDKLGRITHVDSAGSGMGTIASNSTYGTLERGAAVILPSGSECSSTTENV